MNFNEKIMIFSKIFKENELYFANINALLVIIFERIKK